VTLLQAGDAIANPQTDSSGGTHPKLPSPARFFAAMIVYLFLAGVSLFGPNAAKVASRFGALVALVMALAPPTPSQPIGPGNRPLIIRFLNLLNSYLIAGSVSVAGQSPQQINPSTLVPNNPGPASTVGGGTPGPGQGATVLGPGVLGGVAAPGNAFQSSSTYTPGGPTQVLKQPLGTGGVA